MDCSCNRVAIYHEGFPKPHHLADPCYCAWGCACHRPVFVTMPKRPKEPAGGLPRGGFAMEAEAGGQGGPMVDVVPRAGDPAPGPILAAGETEAPDGSPTAAEAMVDPPPADAGKRRVA
jgi:hypothetical protein